MFISLNVQYFLHMFKYFQMVQETESIVVFQNQYKEKPEPQIPTPNPKAPNSNSPAPNPKLSKPKSKDPNPRPIQNLKPKPQTRNFRSPRRDNYARSVNRRPSETSRRPSPKAPRRLAGTGDGGNRSETSFTGPGLDIAGKPRGEGRRDAPVWCQGGRRF